MTNANDLLKAGFTDLVSVVPPGVELSLHTKIRPEDRGKVPGQWTPSGWAGTKGWKDKPAPTEAEAAEWDAKGANIGLKGTRFPGLDIDVDDEKLANVAVALAEELLGAAPVRRSRGSRRLLPYAAVEPFGKLKVALTKEGKSHLVEWLADGQQYLVAGMHPAGEPYRWEGETLAETGPDGLTPITREMAAAYLQALAALVAPHGYEPTFAGTGAPKTGEAAAATSLVAPSIEELAALVELLPNPSHYGWHEMVEVMYAIRAAAGTDLPEGLGIFLAWAERWEGGTPDLEMLQDKFLALEVHTARVGWSWLQEKADALVPELYNSAQADFAADMSLMGQLPPAPPKPEERVNIFRPQVAMSDEDVAHRIFGAVEQRLRFVGGSGDKTMAYIWTGTHWTQDTRGAFDRVIVEELRALAVKWVEAAEQMEDEKEAKALKSAARRIQNDSGIRAITNRIRSRLPVEPGDFDRNPWELNTPDGVIDLRTGLRETATPQMMHSRMTNVGMKPGPHPLFDRFMHDLTAGDEEFIAYLQRLTGYFLTGQISEKIMAYAWGMNSDTGKSTFVRLLAGIMGTYARNVSPNLFASKPGREKADNNGMEQLPGVRLALATEPAKGTTWNEAAIKSFTGGDEVEARFLYQAPFMFKPQAKIFIVGNTRPALVETESAMVRRLHIMPFNNEVPRERQEADIERRIIEEEGAAVLAWMFEGCKAWQQGGLRPPAVVVDEGKEYIEEQNVVAHWFEERCVLEPDTATPRSDLFADWQEWANRRNLPKAQIGTRQTFREKMHPLEKEYGLVDKQLSPATFNRQRGYEGVKLKLRAELPSEFRAYG